MKKYIPGLLVIIGMLVITCGNEPPEKLYEGTPEDSLAVLSILNSHPELLKTDDLFIEDYIPVILDPVTFPVADSFFRADSPLVKRDIDSCALSLTVSTRFQDLWFTKDTTCTVTLYDTFTVIPKMHVDKKYTGHYDSALVDTTVIPWDTIAWVLHTIDIDTIPDYDTEENIQAEGLRRLFLEPERDTTVDTETGDTLIEIKEPFQWQLRRISYGTYWFPNKGADVPYIYRIILKPKSGVGSDTILASNYDTLYTGHVMNRLRSPDSLLQYPAGETLGVTVTVAGTIETGNCLFFASCDDTNRVQLDKAIGNMVISGDEGKIVNLYFEVVVKDSYYYKKPNKGYNATVWLIPIKIGGAQ